MPWGLRTPTARTILRTVALVCGLALLGVASGRVAISHYGLPAVEVLVVIPLLIGLIPRPLAACTLLLVLLCSVPSYEWLPRANVPGHPPINLGDVALIIVVGATLWRRPRRTWPREVRRIYLAVGVMLLVALVSTAVTATHGYAAARDAMDGFKVLAYALVGLTVALELSGPLWWPTINVAIVIATIVAFLSILAAASGSVDSLFTTLNPQSVLTAAADTTVGTTSRIRLPGLFFVYAMTIPTLVMVMLVRDRWRSARIVALLLMLTAIALSLNRNMYFGGIAGLLVTLLVGGPRLRHQVLIVIATFVAIVALVLQSAILPAVTAEVSQRAASALSSQVLSSSSATTREDEFSHALTSIEQHPWTGVGWYAQYGYFTGTDVPQTYVEDWYLHLATDLGIPVAVLFLVAPLLLFVYGVRRARTATTSLDRGMVAAGVGTLVALLLSCLVGTYLQDANSMAAFGFASGLLVAAGMRAGVTASIRSPGADPVRTA
jgi:O-Antigen ligase